MNSAAIQPAEPAMRQETVPAVNSRPSSDSPRAERYVFIDALRGIAALMVMLHHLLHGTVMEPALRRALPAEILAVFSFGVRGVQIFFVISGFVIAYSLRNTVPSWQSAGNFILRRQLRLDPAYWVTLAVTLIYWKVRLLIPSLHTEPFPSFRAIVANIFYLQKILRQDEVVGAAWTLAIEIQFYLFFMAVLWLIFHTCRCAFPRLPKFAAPVVLVSGALSLSQLDWSAGIAFFTTFWCYFAIGVLVSWSVNGVISLLYPLGLVVMMGVAAELGGGQPMWMGAITGAAILLLGRMKLLTRWSGGAVLQYFGRISYSLYLVHFLILVAVMSAGYKLVGDSPWLSVVWMVAGAGAAIAGAQLLYMTVERPTMRLASRLKQKKAADLSVPKQVTV